MNNTINADNQGNHTTVSLPAFQQFFIQPTGMFPDVDNKVNCSTMATENRRNTGIGKPKQGGLRMFPLGDWKLCWGYSSLLELPEVKVFDATWALVERWLMTSMAFSGTSKLCGSWCSQAMIREVSMLHYTSFSPSHWVHASLVVALNTKDHHPWICRVGDNKCVGLFSFSRNLAEIHV